MSILNPVSLRRRFVLLTVLTWLPTGVAMAAMVLLMLARDLDLATIGLIMVLQSVVVTVLELPTGGLADVIGRKGVLAVSAGFGLAGFAWMAIASTAWEFIAVALLRGVARALSSGPAEAWYVDSVQDLDADGDIRRGLAHGQTAGSIALGAGALAGGAIPLVFSLPADGFISPLSVPMLVSAVLYLGLLCTALFGMPEPSRTVDRPRTAELFRDVPRTIGQGLSLAVRNRGLARLLLTFAVLGLALNTIEMLTPGWFSILTGDPDTAATAYGVVTAVGFGAAALGSGLSPSVTTLLKGRARRTAVIGTLVSGFGMASMFATGSLTGITGLVAIGTGYAVIFIGAGLRGPVQSELIHREVTSGQRATVVSMQSLLLQGGGAVGALGIPWLVASWSVPGAWLLSGLALAGSAVLFSRAKSSGSSGEAPVRAAVGAG